MTKEEIIKILEQGNECNHNCEHCNKCTQVNYDNAIKLVIEMLKK